MKILLGLCFFYASITSLLAVEVNDSNSLTSKPDIKLIGVFQGSRKILVKDPILFNHDQTSFSIEVSSSHDDGDSNLSYKYRLQQDAPWLFSNSNEIHFPFLAPDKYQIEIRTYHKGSQLESPSIHVNIHIPPPFYKRWYFILFIILIIGSVIFIIIDAKRNELKEKLTAQIEKGIQEKRAIELKQEALRAQINPHFMFNALSSIRSYVNKKDFQSSDKYIVQFSRLMRLILDSSIENMVLLEREIEMIELYLSLEQLRHEFNFEFEIKYDDEFIEDAIKIPSMIVQPFLENAIIHGVSGMKDGKIIVEIIEDESVSNQLIVRVKDNGIGRQKARELQKSMIRDHKSRGISITQERLGLMSQGERGIDIVIIDREREGNSFGTEVEIILPFK